MVSKIQWKPFWLATQLYPPNDWTGWQNGANNDLCAQAPLLTIFVSQTHWPLFGNCELNRSFSFRCCSWWYKFLSLVKTLYLLLWFTVYKQLHLVYRSLELCQSIQAVRRSNSVLQESSGAQKNCFFAGNIDGSLNMMVAAIERENWNFQAYWGEWRPFQTLSPFLSILTCAWKQAPPASSFVKIGNSMKIIEIGDRLKFQVGQ